MKKKIIKILTTLILIIFICTNILYVNAFDFQGYDPRKSGSSSSAFFGKAGVVIGWISTLGIVIAVIALTVMGLKFMLNGVEEKAEYKKSMIPYIIGCFMLMAASIVVKLIANVAEI